MSLSSARRQALFVEPGPAALDEVRALTACCYVLAEPSSFPLGESQAAALCAGLSRQVEAIGALAAEAVVAL